MMGAHPLTMREKTEAGQNILVLSISPDFLDLNPSNEWGHGPDITRLVTVTNDKYPGQSANHLAGPGPIMSP